MATDMKAQGRSRRAEFNVEEKCPAACTRPDMGTHLSLLRSAHGGCHSERVRTNDVTAGRRLQDKQGPRQPKELHQPGEGGGGGVAVAQGAIRTRTPRVH